MPEIVKEDLTRQHFDGLMQKRSDNIYYGQQ